MGVFGLLIKGPWYNMFLNLGYVQQSYNKVDYFQVEGERESGWKTIPGYTISRGNVNANEWTDVFVNLAINGTPVFSNVIDYSNDFVVGTESEIINSIEMGVKWSKHPWSMNFNCIHGLAE